MGINLSKQAFFMKKSSYDQVKFLLSAQQGIGLIFIYTLEDQMLDQALFRVSEEKERVN